MEWREVDLAARTWTLPAARSKNKRVHQVPLSDAAVEMIAALPRIEGRAGLVFTTTGRSAVSGFSKAKAAIDATILELMRAEAEAAGADPADVKAPEHWIFHDLRRSTATGLQKLGVRLEVTEAVLNHVSGSRAGIVGVYQRHEYAAEKRAALEAWGRYLDALLTGKPATNVVEIAKARG